MNTSLIRTISSIKSRPASVRTSSVIRRFPRWYSGWPAPLDHAGMNDISSNTLFVSTLITSAPREPRILPVSGSAT